MAKKYYSMNEVPVGTKMKVKETGKEVILIEIQHFPTSFKTKNEDDKIKNYSTYEVDIDGWPPEE